MHIMHLLTSCILALLMLVYCASTAELNTDAVISDQVPTIFLSNISSVNHTTNYTISNNNNNNNNQVTKVPSNANASLEQNSNNNNNNAAYTQQQMSPQQQLQSQQSPASIFFANYNNQQNVLLLVRSIDARLRNIRNTEMRVPKIQEIFDSLHFSSAYPSSWNSSNENQQRIQRTLQQDLQIFSKRLTKKLEKAKHIVLELREFFNINVTKVLLQQNTYDDDEDDADDELSEADANDDDVDDETSFDIDMDDFEKTETTVEQNLNHLHLYLNTYIENCQPTDLITNYVENGGGSVGGGITSNYNKQQIQILNYLKTDVATASRSALLNENNARSMAANAYIAEKLVELKNRLTQNDVFDWSKESNGGINSRAANGKFKFFGNHYKHIYFLSHSDGVVPANGQFIDAHFRQLYVSAIKRKFVLLLIDVGSALNAELLELSKSYVTHIIQLLTDTDSISIVTVADDAECMYLDVYPNEAARGIYAATRAHKEEILNYINNLSIAKALTNHTFGFEYSFKMLQKLQKEKSVRAEQPIEFVYVTRGLLTNLSDAMHVLRVVAAGQAQLATPIIINTCAVVLDEKRIMYEQQFLCDIATQNFTKYDINASSWLPAHEQRKIVGKCFVLTKTHNANLISASTKVFEQLFDERFLADNLVVHTPVVETESRDAIVSITHAVPPYGVIGVNLYLADLIEDILNYQQPQINSNKLESSYAFIVERNTGNTIAHPAFPRPSMQSQTSYPVDISYLENATDFSTIRLQMLQQDQGNMSTNIYLTNNRKKIELMQRSYYWQSILGVYVLCLVSTTKMEPSSSTKPNLNSNGNNDFKTTLQISSHMPIPLQRFTVKENIPQYAHNAYNEHSTATMELLYHRLDLLPLTNVKTCRYFHQMATFDSPTLFLSAAAFESPFTFLYNNRLSTQNTQMRTMESIMAYLKDSTGLLANPGLRPQIRNEVNALYNAMQHLKKRHQDTRGTLRNYIIRRYIATVSGVMQVYPGCMLSGNYDATRRPWFVKAMQQPGKIVTTAPYLDAGGAGYIVTIAHTIFEGKAHALHSIEHDQPVAIVAMDLPYAFYYKLILDTTHVCHQPSIKCLLFEHEGYLIAHPSMLESSTQLRNQRRPYEHLTHKESYLANDILNHKSLVLKHGCNNYQNRTLQRYYAFNTSLTEILSNVVHGERTKYAISLVRGSNIFAAVLNSTCDGGAFCPCSTIDRVCLNCNRMDQTDCECPCECPMENDDEETYVNYTQQFSYCMPPSEHFVVLPSSEELSLLPNCQSIICDVYVMQSECLAIMGCEWCQQDLDGNNFSTAFCTTQTSCFNGVLASLTPYGDLDELELIAAHGYNPQGKQNSYSALGPVGGAIIVLVIVIGFAIYCYRHNLDTHAQDQFYIDSMQEENYGLPLSRFNFDDCQAHDEPPGNGYDHTAAQRNLMNPADISPYHVSTGSSYRRPPNGESDHGYSTMTPHEDSSDHQCFTLAEPLLLHDKRHSKSDTMSISTSISSPTNRHQQPPAQHPYLNQQPTPTTAVTKQDIQRYNASRKHSNTSARGAAAAAYEPKTLPSTDLEQTQLTSTSSSPHYILAPVTVHRHMETSES